MVEAAFWYRPRTWHANSMRIALSPATMVHHTRARPSLISKCRFPSTLHAAIITGSTCYLFFFSDIFSDLKVSMCIA